jgi:hypothetical protein
VKKYFIMEDGCNECSDDWNGQGPNGGPGLRHIDLWLGGQGGSAFDAIDCEDALTHYNADNTPVLEPVVVDPPSTEPYDATPIFDTGTGACYGGAQPNTTVGQYRNTSTGTCTALTAGSCSGDQARWTFTAAGSSTGLSVTPSSVSVAPGASATATVTATGATSGTLSASGAPAGVTVSFSPASVPVGGTSTATVTAAANAAPGSATITITGGTKTASLGVTVTGGGGTETLLSQDKTATASSTESTSYPASAAFDGNLTGTRWASKETAAEWLRVDLGAVKAVSHVKLTWEAAYGKAYSVQTSPDGTNWTTIYSTTSGNGATDDLTGLSGTGRYVRMNGVTRGTAYGYSLYEMQVYGTA